MCANQHYPKLEFPSWTSRNMFLLKLQTTLQSWRAERANSYRNRHASNVMLMGHMHMRRALRFPTFHPPPYLFCFSFRSGTKSMTSAAISNFSPPYLFCSFDLEHKTWRLIKYETETYSINFEMFLFGGMAHKNAQGQQCLFLCYVLLFLF